ncbi:MAG TPA: galactose-1-phosphate uridylyltransferase [Cytophagales bacterium]|nr:galactose-1-phosphate uridylyltransferase [Cytophagales bacterium]
MKDLYSEYSHRRYNILTGEWVQVSPHRTKRPWQGKVEDVLQVQRPEYDPNCYLCPGNTRAKGEVNPQYTSTFAFQNDFAAIQEDLEPFQVEDGFLRGKSERGICRVLCFSPRHDLTLPRMSLLEIEAVVRLWKEQYAELGAIPYVNHVQIFENKGEIMGCSNPHPHGQVWAQESIPVESHKKGTQQLAYFQKKESSLLQDYLQQELGLGERILFENEHFVVVVPFWAVWPFETMLAPKQSVPNLKSLNQIQITAFAEALQWLTIRYDNLFETSFPYSTGIHQAPTDGQEHPEWHWHMSFYPPLLRSATVKKFMVGYEMFANPQRDITPEQAAGRLRSLSGVHYLG